jgi:hypothetical protein
MPNGADWNWFVTALLMPGPGWSGSNTGRSVVVESSSKVTEAAGRAWYASAAACLFSFALGQS